MDTVEDYKNTGFHRIGKDTSAWVGKPRTIVILGVARSGTSIVSGALHHLGVFTGDYSKDPVYEDVRMSDAFKSSDWDQVEEVIRDYNGRYSVWAYKRPNIIQAAQRMGRFGRLAKRFPFMFTSSNELTLFNFNRFISQLRNPIFIVTFKDLFAISNRNRISMNFNLLSDMNKVWRQYGGLLRVIGRPGFHGLLVSVDKAVQAREAFLAELISFCALAPTADHRNEAKAFITDDPKRYLDVARATKSIGYLDGASNDCIHGWVRYLDNERIATVALFIDGLEVAQTQANLFRQDLLDSERHSRGRCAFRFQNFDTTLLKPGTEIRVRATEDMNDLGNCPHIYDPEPHPLDSN